MAERIIHVKPFGAASFESDYAMLIIMNEPAEQQLSSAEHRVFCYEPRVSLKVQRRVQGRVQSRSTCRLWYSIKFASQEN